MDSAVQAIGGSLDIQIGPERLHCLLPAHPAPGIAEQTAKQGARAAAVPGTVCHGLPFVAHTALNPKLPKQINAQTRPSSGRLSRTPALWFAYWKGMCG